MSAIFPSPNLRPTRTRTDDGESDRQNSKPSAAENRNSLALRNKSDNARRPALSSDSFRFFFQKGSKPARILIVKNVKNPTMCRDYQFSSPRHYYCIGCFEVDKTRKNIAATVDFKVGGGRIVTPPTEHLHLHGCVFKKYDELCKKYQRMEFEAKNSTAHSDSESADEDEIPEDQEGGMPESRKRPLRDRSSMPEYFGPIAKRRKAKTSLSVNDDSAVNERKSSKIPTEITHLLEEKPLKNSSYLLAATEDEDNEFSFYVNKVWVADSDNSIKYGYKFMLETELTEGRSVLCCKECKRVGTMTYCFVQFSKNYELQIRADKKHAVECEAKMYYQRDFETD